MESGLTGAPTKGRRLAGGSKAMLAIVMCMALMACDRIDSNPPDIKFAPYGEGYAAKPDFAQIEYQLPLTPTDLARHPELLPAVESRARCPARTRPR